MKTTSFTSAAALVLMLALQAPVARAESTEATCELRKDGDTREKASGPCTFSQRQGNITVQLKNGKTYNLNAGSKADHFKDEKGNKVVRSNIGANSQVYKWEHTKLIVTFDSDHRARKTSSDDRMGETPRDLRDVVHGRLVGAEVDDALSERGYKHVKDSKSRGELYANWRKKKTDDCVSVRLDKDRRVKSIVNVPESDCR